MSFRQPNEDMFEGSRMTFGEHLEELRKVLFKAVIALAIGCLIGFIVAERAVKILVGPLNEAMVEYDTETAKQKIIEEQGFVSPESLPWLEEKYAPRQVKVDPGELVEILQTVIPDLGEKVEINPYTFGSNYFHADKIPQLAKRISDPESAEAEFQEQLRAAWKLLSVGQQATLTKIATQSEASSADLEAVVSIFDSLSNSKLNDDPAFEELLTESSFGLMSFFASADPKPLAKMKTKYVETNDPLLNRRLNRALLGQMFPEEMPIVRKELADLEIWELIEYQPQSLAATDSFLIWLKTGLLVGTILALPAVLYFLWSFVAAGLYPHEQKYVHLFLPISIALFIGGVLLAFYFVFQPVLSFLFSFNRNMGIAPEMRINDWLSFVMFLPLGFGIAFQLPLVMLFMNRINLFTVEAYLSKWRIAVMCIFVLSMLLTPADPISMLLMAVPLTFLYFFGIGMCKWMPGNENPFGDVEPNSYSN